MTKRFFSLTKDINVINILGFYQSILYIIFNIQQDYHYYYKPISTRSCATHCHRTLQTVEFKMLLDIPMDENNKGLLIKSLIFWSRNPKQKISFTKIVLSVFFFHLFYASAINHCHGQHMSFFRAFFSGIFFGTQYISMLLSTFLDLNLQCHTS